MASALKNEGGAWEASSLVLPLGQHLAWISMVLVTTSRRSGGVGTSLLKRCLDEVKANDAVAGLDATEQGRPIYLKLGFHDLYKIARWHLDTAKDVVPSPPGVTVRPFTIADLPEASGIRSPALGMERPTLLAHLATRQPGSGVGWRKRRPASWMASVWEREGGTPTPSVR